MFSTARFRSEFPAFVAKQYAEWRRTSGASRELPAAT
jgi:hypothetical protein